MASDEASTYATGVTVIVACTLFNSSGMLLQRLAHHRNEAIEREATGLTDGDADAATSETVKGAAARGGYGSSATTTPKIIVAPELTAWHLEEGGRRPGTSRTDSDDDDSGSAGNTPLSARSTDSMLASSLYGSSNNDSSSGAAKGKSGSKGKTGPVRSSSYASSSKPGGGLAMTSLSSLSIGKGGEGAGAMPSGSMAVPVKLANSRSPRSTSGSSAKASRNGSVLPGSVSSTVSSSSSPSKPLSRREQLIARGYFCLSPWWLAGICSQVFGGLCAVAGITLLGQARCAVFAGLTLMWSQLFAALFLKERFTWVDALATSFIASGSTLAAVYGAENAGAAANPTFESLLEAMRGNTAKISGGIIGLFMAGLLGMLAYRWYVARTTEKSTGECILIAVTGGFFSRWASAGSKLVSAGISSALKSHGEEFRHAPLYLCLFGVTAALTLQIGFLNLALKRYDALTAVPPYECTLTLLGVAFGWLFLDEASGTSTQALSMFFLGSVLCTIGVFILGLKPWALRWKPDLLCGDAAAVVVEEAGERVADCCAAVTANGAVAVGAGTGLVSLSGEASKRDSGTIILASGSPYKPGGSGVVPLLPIDRMSGGSGAAASASGGGGTSKERAQQREDERAGLLSAGASSAKTVDRSALLPAS